MCKKFENINWGFVRELLFPSILQEHVPSTDIYWNASTKFS